MARILKQQQSLNNAHFKWVVSGLAFLLLGIILVVTMIYLDFSRNNYQKFTLFAGILLAILGLRLISKGKKFIVGAVGESAVSKVMADFPRYWYIFNDMFVGSSQIDHIIVCPKGVYTIETKNYKGTIYGNAEKKEWTQVFKKDGKYYRYSFYNPVKQGMKHSLELSNYLKKNGLKKIWVNTVIVFTNKEVELKVFSKKVPVLYLSNLREYFEKRKSVFSSNQCIDIGKLIQKLVSSKRLKC